MLERRKYKRFKSRLLIATVYRDDRNQIVVEDSIFSEDISPGGVRIVFPRQLAKDKILDLKVYLFADPIPLSAKGKIVWSSRKQRLKLTVSDNREKPNKDLFWIGIEFIDIDSFTRKRIIRWIKKEFNVQEVRT